jgi:hypothetical protein
LCKISAPEGLWRVPGQKQPRKDSDCLSCAKISEPSGKLRWRVRVNRADFRIVSRRPYEALG